MKTDASNTFISQPHDGLIYCAEPVVTRMSGKIVSRRRKLIWSVMTNGHADSIISSCYVPLDLRRAAYKHFGFMS